MPSLILSPPSSIFFFFFTAPSTSEIYTLSLHDALPICDRFDALRPDDPKRAVPPNALPQRRDLAQVLVGFRQDRKSTRLNSSHRCISYAVFCLKKKNKKVNITLVRNCIKDDL